LIKLFVLYDVIQNYGGVERKMAKVILIALGGNAIKQSNEKEHQKSNLGIVIRPQNILQKL